MKLQIEISVSNTEAKAVSGLIECLTQLLNTLCDTNNIDSIDNMRIKDGCSNTVGYSTLINDESR